MDSDFKAVLTELCDAKEELGKVYAALYAAERAADIAKAELAKAQQSQLKVTPAVLADFPFVDFMDVAWLACIKKHKIEAIKALRRADTALSLTAAKAAVDAFMALGSPNSTRLALLMNEAKFAQDHSGNNDEEIKRAVAKAARCA